MGGGSYAYFILCISSSWVNLRLHTENQLYTLPGSALKVCGGGGWVDGRVGGGWVLKVNLVIAFG